MLCVVLLLSLWWRRHERAQNLFIYTSSSSAHRRWQPSIRPSRSQFVQSPFITPCSLFRSSQFNEIRAFPMIIMFIMFSHKYMPSNLKSRYFVWRDVEWACDGAKYKVDAFFFFSNARANIEQFFFFLFSFFFYFFDIASWVGDVVRDSIK